MNNALELKFDKPSFIKRIKGMLGVDFYRLFHTPMYYIFLCIAAIIPAMILGMMGSDTSGAEVLYTNTWQIIAADSPLYIVNTIGEYANMNMVYIFGGIMISIFIGRDYKSGYVKQLFTTHAKKQDYILSKSLVGAFCMMCMCITYLIGSVISGWITGSSFSVDIGSLICAILGKLIMSLGWASLYAFINVVFRKYFGVSIVLSFALGTGIIIIGMGGLFSNSSFLNIFLYGSSVNACLTSGISTVFICLAVSSIWAVLYNCAGAYLLSKTDVY